MISYQRILEVYRSQCMRFLVLPLCVMLLLLVVLLRLLFFDVCDVNIVVDVGGVTSATVVLQKYKFGNINPFAKNM